MHQMLSRSPYGSCKLAVIKSSTKRTLQIKSSPCLKWKFTILFYLADRLLISKACLVRYRTIVFVLAKTEMEGVEHMTHEHPLILTKHKNTPGLYAACFGCPDSLWRGQSVYRCSRTHGASTSTLAPSCVKFFLHKTCSEVPPQIQDPRHEAHLLTLHMAGENKMQCEKCRSRRRFVYCCKKCKFSFCLKCAKQERNFNHHLHSHPLTLLPLKSDFTCGACGREGIKEFSYLCQTCMFWIHKSCALVPKTLMHKLHHHDHPLVLSNSLPKGYHRSGLVCSICWLEFDEYYWLYYCSDCRFFAHIECATKPTDENATEVHDEEDANLVQFPVCADERSLYYRLIEEFARSSTSTDNDISTIDDGINHRLIEEFARSSTSTDNDISTLDDGINHCIYGHQLVLIDEDTRKENVDLLNEMFCSGCFQPLSVTTDSLYGCGDCYFFLHKLCSTELPEELEHPSHPEHILLRCQEIGNCSAGKCNICKNHCHGIFYKCEIPSCSFLIDIICASLPRKIKHESHRHALKQVDEFKGSCNGCDIRPASGSFYSCNICQFHLHVGCATSQGTVKHRWDEHQLHLMCPPVKHHPHDFDCEFCSEDINPNYWFYHCRECDISLHLKCMKEGDLLDNFDGANLRFPDLPCAIL